MAWKQFSVRTSTEFIAYSILFCPPVTVSGATNGDQFRGVLLVAKRLPDNQIVGTWSTTDGNLRTVNCNGASANTGATHNSDADKSQATASWTAPAGVAQGDIVIAYANSYWRQSLCLQLSI